MKKNRSKTQTDPRCPFSLSALFSLFSFLLFCSLLFSSLLSDCAIQALAGMQLSLGGVERERILVYIICNYTNIPCFSIPSISTTNQSKLSSMQVYAAPQNHVFEICKQELPCKMCHKDMHVCLHDARMSKIVFWTVALGKCNDVRKATCIIST